MWTAPLCEGGKRLLLYVTLFGKIGALQPLLQSEKTQRLLKLEAAMMQRTISPLGESIESYRSSLFPSVVSTESGDKCRG